MESRISPAIRQIVATTLSRRSAIVITMGRHRDDHAARERLKAIRKAIAEIDCVPFGKRTAAQHRKLLKLRPSRRAYEIRVETGRFKVN